MKTQTTVRVEENSYKEAKDILKTLGMSYSQAINIFNNMIVLKHGIPFDIKIPNKTTLEAISQSKNMEGDFIGISDL